MRSIKFFIACLALCLMASSLGKLFSQESGIYAIIKLDQEKGDTILEIDYHKDVPKTSETVYRVNLSRIDLVGLKYEEWGLDRYHFGENEYVEACKRAVVKDFSKMIHPLSCVNWFWGFLNIEKIEGLETLNTSDVKSMKSMFDGCESLKHLDISFFDTKACENMSYMFNDCHSLKSLNIHGINTENVRNMESMFKACGSLEALDLSSFNTSEVTNARWMFGAGKCESLDLSSFDLSKVYSVVCMFRESNRLKYLFAEDNNINSKSIIENPDNSDNAFYSYNFWPMIIQGVKENGDIVKPAEKGKEFNYAEDGGYFTKKSNIVDVEVGILPSKTIYCLGDTLDLSGGYISRRVKFGAGDTFNIKLYPLEALAHTAQGFRPDIKGSQTISVEYGGERYEFKIEMLGDSTEQNYYATVEVENQDTILYIKGYDIKPSVTGNVIFVGEYQLGEYKLSNGIIDGFEGKNNIKRARLLVNNKFEPINMEGWFNSLEALEKIEGLGNLNTEKVKTMEEMFASCKSLKTLDLSRFNAASLENTSSMFAYCESLKNIEFGEDFNTYNVSRMDNMFRDCKALKELDLSRFSTEKTDRIGSMFEGCSSLLHLDLSGFTTALENIDLGAMFRGCSSLEFLDLSSFDYKIESVESMFEGCTALKNINFGNNFNTENVKKFYRMFYGCESLKDLNLGSFNTSNATSMSDMFNGCKSLESLDLTGFNTGECVNMTNIFTACENLKNIFVGEDFDKSKMKDQIQTSLNSYKKEGGEQAWRWDTIVLDKYFEGCSTLFALKTNGDKVNWSADALGLNKMDVAENGGYLTRPSTYEVVVTGVKTIYTFGDPFELKDGYMTKIMTFGRGDTLKSNLYSLEALGKDVVSGYDAEKVGEQEVTISYGGYTVSLKVMVLDKLKRVKVSSDPTLKEYELPLTLEKLDLAGGVIKKTYVSGEVECAMDTLKYEVSGLDSIKAGENTLVLSFNLSDTTFEWNYVVNVINPTATEDLVEAAGGLGDGAAFEAWTSGGVLSVSAVRTGVLEVFGVNGVLLRRFEVAAGSSVNLPLEKGVYVLRLGGEVRKVVVG